MTSPTGSTTPREALREAVAGFLVSYDTAPAFNLERGAERLRVAFLAAAQASSEAPDPDDPMHTDEEYIDYGAVQYRRGFAQAKYEAEHPASSEAEGLDELRALSEAATPGEWGAFGQPGGDPWLVITHGGGLSIMVTGPETREPEHDAKFLAAAVNYVRARLGESRHDK